MKKKFRLKTLVLRCARSLPGLTVILLAVISGPLRAQDAYRLADPDIKILGTSNLHNWSMEAKDLSCSAKFTFGSAAGSPPTALNSFDLTIPVHNLKSGESSMDSRAYTAMKADKFATITYASASAVVSPGKTANSRSGAPATSPLRE